MLKYKFGCPHRGKNAVRWNWILRVFKTYEVLTRASSVCVMMNKLTRRLSKIPEEARREFESYFVNSALILEDDNRKLPKLDDNTADYIYTGLHFCLEFVMVLMASAATSFPIILPSLESSTAKGTKLGGWLENFKGLKFKHAYSSGGMQVKAINGNKNATSDMLINNPFRELIHDGYAFSENFCLRSFDVDADRTASIETLLSLLQETALNGSRASGLLADGFSTPKMQKKNLVWVYIRMQIVFDRYPIWGEVVQVNNWISTSRKNAIRLDWLMCDNQTGETLTRASCVAVMMNKLTRRLCRVPEEVKEELQSRFVNSAPILEQDNREIPKLDDNTAGYICTGLRATRNDLDFNQHVNNVKYVGWVLKSVPESISESHEVAAMTLDYKRECGRGSKLQSLTAISGAEANNHGHHGHIECDHLLRLENGVEVVRGRTEWRPKLIPNN